MRIALSIAFACGAVAISACAERMSEAAQTQHRANCSYRPLEQSSCDLAGAGTVLPMRNCPESFI